MGWGLGLVSGLVLALVLGFVLRSVRGISLRVRLAPRLPLRTRVRCSWAAWGVRKKRCHLTSYSVVVPRYWTQTTPPLLRWSPRMVPTSTPVG